MAFLSNTKNNLILNVVQIVINVSVWNLFQHYVNSATKRIVAF